MSSPRSTKAGSDTGKLPSRIRSSLFWTFTGAFLAALIIAIALQGVLIAAVLRPAARSWREATRAGVAQSVAAGIGRAIESGEEDLGAILRRFEELRRQGLLVAYRDPEGAVYVSLPPEQIPPGLRPLLRGRGELMLQRRTVGSATVYVRGEARGRVEAIRLGPPERFPWPEGTPPPGLLFLPLAAIISGAAGLILFLGIVRRISRLDHAVRRIAAGDLDARVAETGEDEVGRLGDSFNLMAARVKESRERLLEADRQRRRFLADVTHDLATPLTSIRGYAETLLDPSVPKTRNETEGYVRFIHEEALRMNALVNDLLDLARVEAGGVPLEREELDLTALSRAEVERMRPHFAEAGLSLTGPEEGRAVEVVADPRRCAQLVSNLLSNALRYVPPGGSVRVSVQKGTAPVQEGTAQLVGPAQVEKGSAQLEGIAPLMGTRRVDEAILVVEDDGPGFSPEDLPHLFDRFYRGNPARPAGGTGLGLAIVKGIARAHGGDARAENRPDGGARIIVRLPAAGAPES